jgi:hypothetical protein
MLYKVLNSLPAELERDSLYFVQKNGGFDFYVTNHYGSIVQAYPLNRPEILPVTNTISSYSQETFFEISLSEKKSFEWSVEISKDDNLHTRKVMAVLNNNILEGVEFAILGHHFNIDIEVSKNDDNCNFILHNNEPFDIFASVKLL